MKWNKWDFQLSFELKNNVIKKNLFNLQFEMSLFGLQMCGKLNIALQNGMPL